MKNLFLMTGAMAAVGAACAQTVVTTQAATTQTVTTQQVIAAAAPAVDQPIQLTTSQLLDAQFAEFAQKRGIHYGVTLPDGVCYFKSSEIVNVAPQKPEFIKARSMAFARAYVNALGDYVKYRTGAIASETASRVFRDDSNNTMEPPASLEDTEKGLAKKVAVLSEANVDKALQNLGIDPSQYTAKPVEQRRQTLLNSILKKSLTRAVGSSTGVAIVKTIEARTAAGTYAIGAILKYDPAYEAVAECMARKQHPVISAQPGVSIEQLLGTGEAQMVQNFGTRFYYDEKGNPALISFGQWGSQYTGNDPRRMERSGKNALEQAESLANIQLSEFIQGSVDFYNDQEVSETLDEANVFDANGAIREDSVTRIIDLLEKRVSIAARDTLKGRQVVFSQLLRHPGGQMVALVAVRWSFDQLDAVNAQQNRRSAQPQIESKDKGTSGVRVGDEYDF